MSINGVSKQSRVLEGFPEDALHKQGFEAQIGTISTGDFKERDSEAKELEPPGKLSHLEQPEVRGQRRVREVRNREPHRFPGQWLSNCGVQIAKTQSWVSSQRPQISRWKIKFRIILGGVTYALLRFRYT